MRQLIRISVLLAIIFLSIHTSESSVRLQNTPGVFAAWNLTNPSTPIVANGRVTYSLDSAGSDDIPFSQVEQAITASFQSWEDIPTSTIAFQRGPNITSDKTFHEDQFDIYWVEDSEMVNGMDISGALAVTFSDSNAQTGEFTGIAMVFNGVSFTWATDGRAGSLDVQAVATHEIGHSIGLDHSPIAASTMFPTTGEGRLEERTLSRDDQIAASIIYPTPDFFSTTGIVSGQVLDNTGAPIFGAHVVAVDANGVVITGALSQSNGTYSIAGLPSGSYNIYAQPLGSNDNKFFSRGNLSSTYSNADIDFQTSQDFPVFVNPGMTTPLQIPVIRGTPAFAAFYVAQEPQGNAISFANIGRSVFQGQNTVIGALGPGLSQTSSLVVSGPGITYIGGINYGTTDTGLPYLLVSISVDTTAPIGPRNIIITDGTQRAILTGGLEVFANPQGPTITIVASQADYSTRFAPESLAAAFGSNLASVTMSANSNPLPADIGGTSVTIIDSSGTARSAGMMYVSPGQVNFQLPAGLQVGTASVILVNQSGSATTTIDIQPVAPAILTQGGIGVGLPIGSVIRFRADGTSHVEPLARFDSASGTYLPIPIDMGLASDRIMLVLFGTGFRYSSQLPTVTIGGVDCQVVYAGRQGDPPFGLDQVNVFLNRAISGGGPADIVLTASGMQANPVTVSIAAPIAPTVSSIVSQASYSTLLAPGSLAAAFGSNLAVAVLTGNSSQIPGSSISVIDSAGTIRLAPLMYVSSNQINFQIPAGTALGTASFIFTNNLGYTFTASAEIQPTAPALFTRDATGSGLPFGAIVRFRQNGTSNQEPIAQFNPETGGYDPVPINMGSDRILLVLFGTGFRGQTVSVKVGGVDCQVVYAGPQGDSPFLVDQVNVFLDPSLSGSGAVNVVLSVGDITSNTVTVTIQ